MCAPYGFAPVPGDISFYVKRHLGRGQMSYKLVVCETRDSADFLTAFGAVG